jgi:hypothetical protein
MAVADRALPVMEELGLIEELANTLINRGTALAWMGRWLEGGVTLRGAAELAKQHDLTLVQLRALNNMRSVEDTDILHDPATLLVLEELVERSGNLGWQYRSWYMTAEARYGSGAMELSGYPYLYEPLLASAAWIGDVDSIRQLAEDFKPRTRRGRVSQGLGYFAVALLAAFEGDEVAAVSAYRTAEALWEETGLPMSMARMRAIFAKSIGIDHPVGLEVGTRARQFFREHNVELYLDLLEDGLPPSEAEDSAVAA